jgi:uncharacterized protein involved in response to NO
MTKAKKTKVSMSDLATSKRESVSLQALFSYGFRPFFLGAGLYALFAMGLWLTWLATGMPNWAMLGHSPFAWHAHEMIFGFAGAAVAGFLLTAVPNWTGGLPLSGSPLMFLFVVWLSGRIAMLAGGSLDPALVAAIDLAFLPILGVSAARQLFVKPAPRNFMLLAILAAMLGSNVAYHLASNGIWPGNELGSLRFALMLLVLLVAIIGGRVIPAFTHNWLHLNRASAMMPQRFPWLDAAAIIGVALLAVLQLLPVPDWVQGCIALFAALANGARLALWRGDQTWRAPIVFILHVGYAWVVVGLILISAAAFGPGLPSVPADHAFGAGAVATMIMAIMTRASLGHTGRALTVPRPIVLAYGLLTLAAFLRVFGVQLAPALYAEVLFAAAAAWMAAFALFVGVYFPILTTPRLSSRARADG